MNPEEITYQNMNRKIVEAVPELRAAYDHAVAEGYDADGPHVLYEELFAGVLPKFFESECQNKNQLRKIFDFLENLANHPDAKIQNVVYVSVCESICSDEAVLQKAQKYLGKTTKRFCDEIMKPKR